MYALTMTKAQIDSLKILTSEKIVSKFRHVVLP